MNAPSKDSCGKRKASDALPLHCEMLPLPLGYGVVSELRCQSLMLRASVEQARQFLMGLVAANAVTLVDREYVEARMYACHGAEGMRRVNGCERFYVSVSKLPRGSGGGCDIADSSKHWWTPLLYVEFLSKELLKCVEAGALGTEEMARLIEALADLTLNVDIEHGMLNCGVPALEKHAFMAAGFNYATVQKASHTLSMDCIPGFRSFFPQSWVRRAEGLPESVIAGCYTCEVGEDFAELFEKYSGATNKGDFKARKRANPFVDGGLPRVSVESEAAGVQAYGVTGNLGSDSEPNHSFVVVCDGKGKAYVLFSGQVFSNFCGPVRGSFRIIDVEGPSGELVACLENPCCEVYFQLAKAAHSKDLAKAEEVLQARKPGAAKAATSLRSMPNCAATWSDVSLGAMRQGVLRTLYDPEVYNLVVDSLKFCAERLHVKAQDVKFVENTDDRVWGCGMEIGEGGNYALAAVEAIASGKGWEGQSRLSEVYEDVKKIVWDFEEDCPVEHHLVVERVFCLPPAFKVVAGNRVESAGASAAVAEASTEL